MQVDAARTMEDLLSDLLGAAHNAGRGGNPGPLLEATVSEVAPSETGPRVPRHPGAVKRIENLMLHVIDTDEGAIYHVVGRGPDVATYCHRTADMELQDRFTETERRWLAERPNFTPADMVTRRRHEEWNAPQQQEVGHGT